VFGSFFFHWHIARHIRDTVTAGITLSVALVATGRRLRITVAEIRMKNRDFREFAKFKYKTETDICSSRIPQVLRKPLSHGNNKLKQPRNSTTISR
jgi:hypothetical protein